MNKHLTRSTKLERSLLAAAALLLLAGPVTAGEIAMTEAFTIAQTTPTGSLSDTTSGDAISTPSNGVAADAPVGQTHSLPDGTSGTWNETDQSNSGNYQSNGTGMTEQGGADYGDSDTTGNYNSGDIGANDNNDNDLNNSPNWFATILALMGISILGYVGYYVWQQRNRANMSA